MSRLIVIYAVAFCLVHMQLKVDTIHKHFIFPRFILYGGKLCSSSHVGAWHTVKNNLRIDVNVI